MVDPGAVPAVQPGAPPPPRGSEVVDWITRATRTGRTITAAVPPHYARYATVVVPDDYLDTGVAHLVDPDAPRVSLYVGWPYVLLEGGPQQALTWRSNDAGTPWHSALPELVFPADRSWLVSTMWDDDWRCVGGPAPLVDALLAHPELAARGVTLDEDVTPPGRVTD